MRDFNRGRDSRGRGDRGDREMFDAVCDECGDNCKVPFKPTGNKPIYCSKCFEKQGGSDSRRDRHDRRNDRSRGRDFNRDRDNRRRGDRKMYEAICDECGEKCEVPFKPNSDKPIYCSNCFTKKNEGGNRGARGDNRDRGGGDDFGKQFKAITEKLDEILQALSLTKPKKVVKKVVPKKKITSAKGGSASGEKKKVVKKKTVAKKKLAKKVTKKKTTPKKNKKKK